MNEKGEENETDKNMAGHPPVSLHDRAAHADVRLGSRRTGGTFKKWGRLDGKSE